MATRVADRSLVDPIGAVAFSVTFRSKWTRSISPSRRYARANEGRSTAFEPKTLEAFRSRAEHDP